MTKWLLLMLTFTGPTSADKLEFGGWFETERACQERIENIRQRARERRFGSAPAQFLCVPPPGADR